MSMIANAAAPSAPDLLIMAADQLAAARAEWRNAKALTEKLQTLLDNKTHEVEALHKEVEALHKEVDNLGVTLSLAGAWWVEAAR